MPAPLCLGRGLAHSEALRFVGFLISENRRASACASHDLDSVLLEPALPLSGKPLWVGLLEIHNDIKRIAIDPLERFL
jgi:hypothetical protein